MFLRARFKSFAQEARKSQQTEITKMMIVTFGSIIDHPQTKISTNKRR